MQQKQLLWAPLALMAAFAAAEPSPAQTPPGGPNGEGGSGGATISYQLPVDGPLPRTYRVTLAITEPNNPDWIISTPAAGVARTVTADNRGKFNETWNGLDDNYMPVPPGTYAVKGIYMPGETWPIDGQCHSIVPKLIAMGGSWGQSPSEDSLPGKVEGDPCGSPLRDVDVASNGTGVVYFQYLENGKNYFLTDFNKPVGYGQIITGYPSGSFAGGSCTCSDGQVNWSFSTDGGRPFIGRGDGKPFGNQSSNRHNVFLPQGWVTGLSAWPDKTIGHTIVFVAERGRIVNAEPRRFSESESESIDEVLALDGNDAHLLAKWKVERPMGVAARGGSLYVLHGAGAGFEVASLPLTSGWNQAQPSTLFRVPEGVKPFDIEADSHGRIYLSDSEANHVHQFDSRGQKLRTYGRLDAQKGGQYDPESFMAPEKLACWTDGGGHDRLLVVEMGGPNRLSEWSGDDGKMIRQWVVPQTRANDGYAVDPRHADRLYIPGQRKSLVRWKIDYSTGQWTCEAVWSNVGESRGDKGQFADKLIQELASPRLIYRGDDVYLVYWRGYAVYHLEGDRWRPCAGIFRQLVDKKPQYYLWRDLNGDGQVQDEEYLPFQTSPPRGTLRYFGETWFDDFSLVCMGQGTNDIWKLTPARFDSRGTPLFDPRGWQKVLTDNIFVDKNAGTAIATRGGNEVGTNFNSDWASVTTTPKGELYVSARSGPNITANFGAQYKLSRYVPDGKGGYVQRWRIGRMAIQGNAAPGEVYGPIFVSPPVNGLVGVVDNSRAGFVLYTEDGLYVDTLFPDAHVVGHDQMGAYWQPGEYFTGYDYVNPDNGKVYLALGKTMPEIYEARGWSTTENPVRPLTTVEKTVSLSGKQIGSPPEIALQLRGSGGIQIGAVYPAPGGGPALDASMNGWEACGPVQFGAGESQKIEARCFYDPAHLYIRWHARLGHRFDAKPLLLPQHIFAHDRGNDTLGLYLQGDANALPGAGETGRPAGRCALRLRRLQRRDAPRPVVVGMYPAWAGSAATPQTYTTPVGSVTFAHVGLVPGVAAGCTIDGDGEGYVLAAAIPRSAIPRLAGPERLAHGGEFRCEPRRGESVLVEQRRWVGQPRDLRRADRGADVSGELVGRAVPSDRHPSHPLVDGDRAVRLLTAPSARSPQGSPGNHQAPLRLVLPSGCHARREGDLCRGFGAHARRPAHACLERGRDQHGPDRHFAEPGLEGIR